MIKGTIYGKILRSYWKFLCIDLVVDIMKFLVVLHAL